MERVRARLFRMFAAALAVAAIGAAELPLSASPLETLNGEQRGIPIIMYHNISKNRGSWDKYTISPVEFEEDLIYLRENGYETVFMSELIDFVHNGASLPEKPVVLSFDDGDFGVAEYAMPLLEEYGARIVVSIIGKATDEMSEKRKSDASSAIYPHLTWEQLQAMSDGGFIEVQSHTYNLHRKNGAKKLPGETDEAYKARLAEDLEKLQERIRETTGRSATTLTYPYGAISDSSDRIARELGFSATLTCRSRVSTVVQGDAESLFGLGRIIRPHGVTPEKIFGKAAQ